MSTKKLNTEIRKFFNGRRTELQRRLTNLSSIPLAIVKMQNDVIADNTPAIKINATIRLKNTNFIFNIVEEFCDVDTNPFLYGFQYSLSQVVVDNPELVFRYECHPEADDPEIQHITKIDSQNPYSIVPHFHPDGVNGQPLKKLHYPFHRQERATIIFALIAWLEVDLVNRYYAS